jgi:hypothetical protein
MAMARHNNEIALTFARIGTHWFEKVVMPYATGLLLLTGNVKFIPKDGKATAAPVPSVLIAYDAVGENRNNEALRHCGLPGTFFDNWAIR